MLGKLAEPGRLAQLFCINFFFSFCGQLWKQYPRLEDKVNSCTRYNKMLHSLRCKHNMHCSLLMLSQAKKANNVSTVRKLCNCECYRLFIMTWSLSQGSFTFVQRFFNVFFPTLGQHFSHRQGHTEDNWFLCALLMPQCQIEAW